MCSSRLFIVHRTVGITTAIVSLCALSIVAPASANPPHYTAVAVGNLGTNSAGVGTSTARGINNRGQVVGYSNAFDVTHSAKGVNAFLYDNGVLTTLGNFGLRNGQPDTRANAINDAGQVTGMSYTNDAQGNNSGASAFLYTNGVMTDLGRGVSDNGYVSSSSGSAINNLGNVVGFGQTTHEFTVVVGNTSVKVTFPYVDAVQFQNGGLVTLPNFGVDSYGYGTGSASGINDNNQVVGGSTVYDANHISKGGAAFLYSQGVLINLGNFGVSATGTTSSNASSINNSGLIVGSSTVYAGGTSKGNAAFLYANGTLSNLGNFGTSVDGVGESVAYSISNTGLIVGYSKAYDSSFLSLGNAGFLYSGGLMYNINSITDNLDGWTITEARGVNDNGWIAATGTKNGSTQAFLLQTNAAAPEPGSFAFVLMGALPAVGLVSRRRRN